MRRSCFGTSRRASSRFRTAGRSKTGRAAMRPTRGFEEVPHTADWAMKVWAEDMPSLFAEAARGMNLLSGLVLAQEPRIGKTFVHVAADQESLLVAFLSELIYLQEQEGLGFDDFELHLQSERVRVQMYGATVMS